ncbi:MAG: acyl carrier protein [Acidimicrobiales bacterium]
MSDNFERFKKCAVDVLSVDEAQITPEATFESLDADSLDLVELVMALEEEFDVNVEEEELEGVTTIQGAFSLVESKL